VSPAPTRAALAAWAGGRETIPDHSTVTAVTRRATRLRENRGIRATPESSTIEQSGPYRPPHRSAELLRSLSFPSRWRDRPAGRPGGGAYDPAVDIGVMVGGSELSGLVEAVREVAAAGFQRAWVPQVFGIEALTAIAVAGREVPDIELGTAVVPTYPRHPFVLAGQALTTAAALGGDTRLHLGIGLSHQVVIEGMLGLRFERPAVHMREYLSVLRPALNGEPVQLKGETLQAAT